ncbi:MAG: FAD-dependent oxidoreductase [Candidatus Eisenbacteria bacterium]|nr:CoB--CoM heterodisulfide reductase iron-sulfur subunit A family protein [Candidatus Eisenbacteria bacterium]
MSRIGVFVCHCGENIGRTVDCARVAEASGKLPGVVVAVDYKYMCSDPGQNLIRNAIREHHLDGVVVAACSPAMHEPTFRRATAGEGVNPFRCEMVNVREHCSWVHEDREAATAKAIDLVRMMYEKVKRNEDLIPIQVPVTRRALVVGGGIAGIQAALDLANAGIEVVMVEKEPSIGGHMSQLSETFPTLDCSQCILTPRMVEVAQHPKITLHTYSEVEKVEGFIGNFRVTVRKKARSVDITKCTGCGVCQTKCPQKKIPSAFDAGLGMRSAIYIPFPQAVPNKPVIDREQCTYFKNGKCGVCKKLCGPQAVDFDQQDELVVEPVGAVVLATGYQLYEIGAQPEGSGLRGYEEYGGGRLADVIDGLQFERLASASGPTGGEIRRPSDGKIPKTIVFLQCIGSRDPAKGIDYCSKICCMYTAKHALLYKHKVHDGRAIVFYMDVRAPGKGYDEFVRRAVEEDEVLYLRGRVSRMYEDGGQIVVSGVDTLSARPMEIRADLVVLATAIRPQPNAARLAQLFGVGYDGAAFYSEAHPKLRPVESAAAGIFLAGACQGPKDIPESVAQASAAASKAMVLFSRDVLEREPVVAKVNETTCAGCFACKAVCPYGAVEEIEVRDRQGRLLRRVARINSGVCNGCGTCQATCPSKSLELAGYTDEQVFAQIGALRP